MEQNVEPMVEKKPGKKKVFLILGIVLGVIVIAGAAFLAGRLLNGSGSSLGLLPLAGQGGNMVSMNVQIEPAPELPTTQPTLVGNFVERQDNSLFVQEFSMDAGAQGGVVVSSSSVSVGGTSSGGVDAPSVQVVVGAADGPKVEVVVTNDTLIYKDVTPMNFSPDSGDQVIQQVVETGSLDDLNSTTMVQVWGRQVGDRVIADVIFYSLPVTITAP
jgi:hypothetical protein